MSPIIYFVLRLPKNRHNCAYIKKAMCTSIQINKMKNFKNFHEISINKELCKSQ